MTGVVFPSVATQRDLSRDDLIERVREIASVLGRETLPRAEFVRETGITVRQIEKHFDTWNELVEAAGLEPYERNLRKTDDELLAALRDAFVEGGGILTRRRLPKHCRFGDYVYAKRFGRWPNVLASFRAWVIENDPGFPYLDDLPEDASSLAPASAGTTPAHSLRPWSVAATPTRYGPFLNFRGLQHAPINEQGVVFLFGMVALDLGYVVEGVGVGFPDCEAKRCVDKSGDMWERVRIEFEYKSPNFLDHGHRATECDVLVCWQHNWRECPVEVLELRSAIETLGD